MAFGLGVNEPEVCERLLEKSSLDIRLLAGRYTLIDRIGARLMDFCAQRDIAIVAGGVFNSCTLAIVAGGVFNSCTLAIVAGGVFNSCTLATGPIEGAYFDYRPANNTESMATR